MPDHIHPRPGQFVAQIVGEPMNRKVPSGSWALFTTDFGGSKQGKVVLAQRREIGDPDEGGRYTLKTYDAHKLEGEDGVTYQSIKLNPHSSDPRFLPIELDIEDVDHTLIVASPTRMAQQDKQ